MPEFLRKYATATDIYMPMIKRGVVDFAVSADWTPAAGDVKVSIDGGAAANIGTLPTAITMGNTATWKFSLASGETTGKKITVTIGDAATKAVEDNAFDVMTYGNASAETPFDLSSATVTVGTNNDKTGYSLSQTFPTNFSLLSIDANGRVDLSKWLGSAINALIGGRVDANAQVVGDKTAYSLSQAFPTNFSSLAITAGGATTVGTNNDKTGYSLTAAAIQAIWDFTLTSILAAGSIGLLIKTFIGAFTYSAPLDAAGTRTAIGLASANLDTQLSGLSTSISALPTANANADALLDRTSGVESGWTLRQLLRLWLAGICGPRTNFNTSAPTVQNPAGTKNRLVGSGIDVDGNGTWTTDVT